MIGRVAFLILVGAMVLTLLLPPAASAAGGTYTVVQCHPDNRDSRDAALREPRAYGIVRGCEDRSRQYAIQIQSRLAAANGWKGSARWVAPPGTGFKRVKVEAKLRRAAHHYSRIFMADAKGRETRRIATGDGSSGTFHGHTWDGARQQQFVAVLGCSYRRGCPQSDTAKTWIRKLRMTLVDLTDPKVSVSGSLVSGGWKRGGAHLIVDAPTDGGSGLREVSVTLAGSTLRRYRLECLVTASGVAKRLRPCAGALNERLDAATDNSPFRDGVNPLAVCAVDFAGNRTCLKRSVNVDNRTPTLSFTNAQDPEDPELIHAVVSDAHSGVADGQIYYRSEGSTGWTPLETVHRSGELQARVDSVAVSSGWYEFRALATDVAGNQVETTRRQDGLTMRLRFPLKSGVDLSAAIEPGGSPRVTVPYGRSARVEGVLRAASGEALTGQELKVVEFFGDGALIRERISYVRTDSRGRWESRLPAGPSRSVVASYAGTQRYLPASATGGRLAVRSRATLKTSKKRVPEGGRVVFRGKLGRLGARIPSGGKLLELQVRQSGGKYQTVGQGFRSRADGSYRIPYRFGRFYQYDVRFRFRLKVARESDWPYQAPIRSRLRTVTVVAR